MATYGVIKQEEKKVLTEPYASYVPFLKEVCETYPSGIFTFNSSNPSNIDVILCMTNNVRYLPDALEQAKKELEEIRLKKEQLLAHVGVLKTEVEEFNAKHHVSGAFAHNAAAVPTDFSSQLTNLFPSVKLYTASVWRRIPKTEQPDFIAKFSQHVAPGVKQEILDTSMIDPLTYRKSILVASLSRELFAYFEMRSFCQHGAVTSYVMDRGELDRINRERKAARQQPYASFADADQHRAAEQYHAFMAVPVEELLKDRSYEPFQLWVQDVVARLKRAWARDPDGRTNDAKWQSYFSDPQLDEVLKQTWALHLLAWAFPNVVESTLTTKRTDAA